MGIRTIVDVVPNHVSDQHPWFQAALAAGPGSPERARFWFRPGRGPGGDEPPNDWVSEFAGVPWTRTKDDDGTPGEWYLHLFTPEQPDLNWTHPDVRREHEDVLRFWFDRGVAGVRIDSAVLVAKDPALPDVGPGAAPSSGAPPTSAYPPGRAPLHRPRRAPRHLRLVAPGGRRLRRAAAARRRGVDARHRAAEALPPPDRAAHGVQPRLPHLPVGPRPPAPQHRHHPRHARRGRRPGHVGPLQPRRDPARHPLRPGRHVVLVRRQAGRYPDRPRTRAASGPGGRPARRWRCPGPSTSTRARSWGCPRSRTSSRT